MGWDSLSHIWCMFKVTAAAGTWGTPTPCWSLSLKKQKIDSPMLLFGNDESWRCRRQVVTRPWKRKKREANLSIIIFPLLAWCYSRKRVGTPVLHCCFDFIPFIFHLSVNASSAFPSGSETVCPFSLLQHWDYRAVCLTSQSKGFHFPHALETDSGFSGKERHAECCI